MASYTKILKIRTVTSNLAKKNLQKSTHTEFLDPKTGKKGKINNLSKYKYEYQNP